MLGGSAVHFSLAASFFTDVRVVGPVGDDFGEAEYAVLHDRGVNTDDIEYVAGGKTFFWRGSLRIRPQHGPHRRHAAERLRRVRAEALRRLAVVPTLFLANIQPDLQRDVRAQCPARRLRGSTR